MASSRRAQSVSPRITSSASLDAAPCINLLSRELDRAVTSHLCNAHTSADLPRLSQHTFRLTLIISIVPCLPQDLFLKWYNAYRFLVQNVRRHEAETGAPFDPHGADLKSATNVLDRWIRAANHGLIGFVRDEMKAYRLYTVAPRLVQFIENLTNIYVRFNRNRLKGKGGPVDAQFALCTLYDVLLTLCKAMAPFTPFLTETIYQNLRKAQPGLPQSVHFCTFPEADPSAFDERIERSVGRMNTIIELARSIREKHAKPVKTPLRKLIVVHPDKDFLNDISGDLAKCGSFLCCVSNFGTSSRFNSLLSSSVGAGGHFCGQCAATPS